MGDLIPIIGMLLVLGPPSALVFSWTPIGRALTQRLKGHGEVQSESLEDMHRLIEDMHDTVDRVALDVDDLRDRLSFAERLLAAGVEKGERVATPV